MTTVPNNKCPDSTVRQETLRDGVRGCKTKPVVQSFTSVPDDTGSLLVDTLPLFLGITSPAEVRDPDVQSTHWINTSTEIKSRVTLFPTVSITGSPSSVRPPNPPPHRYPTQTTETYLSRSRSPWVVVDVSTIFSKTYKG